MVLAPLKFLTTAASAYAQKAFEGRKLVRADLPRLFELLSHTKSLRWKSRFFEKGQGVSAARAETVVDAVFYSNEARRELKRAIDKLGGTSGQPFWDLYLRRVSHSVLGFSEGFLELLQLANTSLPKNGQVVDWNCGNGNLSAALSLSAPDRKVVAIDSNPRAVIAAKRVQRHFFPDGENLFSAKVGSPTSPELSIPMSNGAVLYNGLFLLENDAAKIDFLKEIGANLFEDSSLLLVEPKPWLEKQSVVRLWIQRIVKSAVENHSPMSEFEVALFAEIQRRMFSTSVFTLSTTKQLVALATEAGFEVTLVRDVVYGHYSAILLKKLPVPKKPVKEPLIRYHDDPWPDQE